MNANSSDIRSDSSVYYF